MSANDQTSLSLKTCVFSSRRRPLALDYSSLHLSGISVASQAGVFPLEAFKSNQGSSTPGEKKVLPLFS